MYKFLLAVNAVILSSHAYAIQEGDVFSKVLPANSASIEKLDNQALSTSTRSEVPEGWFSTCSHGGAGIAMCYERLDDPSIVNLCSTLGSVGTFWVRWDDGEFETYTPNEYTGVWRYLRKGESDLFPGSEHVCETRYKDGAIWHHVAKKIEPKTPDEEKELGEEDECESLTNISPMCGNPINISNGNKFQREEDFSHATAPLIKYVRYYNSIKGTLTRFNNRAGWSDNYNIYTLIDTNNLYLYLGDGKAYTFTLNAESGNFIGNEVNGAYAYRENDKHIVVFPDGNEYIFNGKGKVLEQVYKGSERIIFTYSRTGQLQTVRDANRSNLGFNFSYDREFNGALKRVDLVSPYLAKPEAIATFTFDSSIRPQIETVTYRDGSTRRYEYASKYLTGIYNENGQLSRIWKYENDRAVSSSYADGVNLTQISYAEDGSKATMTDALGYRKEYKFTDQNGVAKVYSISLPCREGHCQYTEKHLQFDNDGNVKVSTDAKGNRSHFSYNERDLITQIESVKGLQRIEWHTTLPNPVYISDGTRNIHYEYFPNGQLKKVTENSDSISRSESYSYNDFGQVTEHSSSHAGTIQYTYNSNGELISETNSFNQKTEYSDYNEFGHPQQIIYPTGQVEIRSFDKKGRITTSQKGTLVTHYHYDKAGNLTQVIEPGGNTVTYMYDIADRLVGVTDTTGREITYELDSKGNILKVTQRDPAAPSALLN